MSVNDSVPLHHAYERLRERLLDMTLRNPMLSYKHRPTSKRQLQIVDEVPSEVFRHLTGEASLTIVPLPEPDDVPRDEKTTDFVSALTYAKATDADFQEVLREADEAEPDKAEGIIAKGERSLRDRLREELGMPKVDRQKLVDPVQHARTLGIDPSFELPREASAKQHTDRQLQTLKFPKPLDAILEKLRGDARLAEQETGLSTLFLVFGFLEWVEKEGGTKLLAPLLLLPVHLEATRSELGKITYELTATSTVPEDNLSLRKRIDRDFGLKLPEVSVDADGGFSVEAYLAEVQARIGDLKGWRIRRLLTVGHFVFGRLAMYADLDPQQWGTPHPGETNLVGAVMQGAEGGDGELLFGTREDHPIDDPAIAAKAPFLIQDADASQHSALIDAMDGKNLVIQGPPGTGKSQTITNLIANALAAEKTVLFLAEKQAALEVVKRRLDVAGLGGFCLELHSDKASPKTVIEHLKNLLDDGTERSAGSNRRPDPSLLAAQREVSAYAAALHREAEDGAKPFELMWQAIRARGEDPGTLAAFAGIDLPQAHADRLHEAEQAQATLALYADLATAFATAHGVPEASPWNGLAFGPQVGPGMAAALTDDLYRLRGYTDEASAYLASVADLGLVQMQGVGRLAGAIAGLTGNAPSPILLNVLCTQPSEAITEYLDARAHEQNCYASLRASSPEDGLTDAQLAAVDALTALFAHDGRSPRRIREEVARAVVHAEREFSEAEGQIAEARDQLPIAQGLVVEAEVRVAEVECQRTEARERVIEARREVTETRSAVASAQLQVVDAEGLTAAAHRLAEPFLQMVGVRADSLEETRAAVLAAAQEVTQLTAHERPWFALRPMGNFQAAHVAWRGVVAAEEVWRSRFPGAATSWPTSGHLRAVAGLLRQGFVARLFTARRRETIATTATHLGLPDLSSTEAATLEDLAAHVEMLHAFAASEEHRPALGRHWAGLASPFDEAVRGQERKRSALSRVRVHAGGADIADRLASMDETELARAAEAVPGLDGLRRLPERQLADAHSQLDRLQAELRRRQEQAERAETAAREVGHQHDALSADLRCRREHAESVATAVADPDGALDRLRADLAKRREMAIRLSIADSGGTLAARDEPLSELMRVAQAEREHRAALIRLEHTPLHADLAGFGWDELPTLMRAATHWLHVVTRSNDLASVRELLLGEGAGATITRLRDAVASGEAVSQRLNEGRAILREEYGLDAFGDAAPDDLRRHLDDLLTHSAELPAFIGLHRQRREITQLGLNRFVERAREAGMPAERLPELFARLLSQRRAEWLRRRDPVLSQVDGSQIDARRRAFADADRRKIESDRATIRAKLVGRLPLPGNGYGPRGTWTEGPLLKNEMNKQKRFVPVRDLMRRASASLQELTPCFMMSPLSLAKFLPRGQVRFDLLIVDEASQMRPEDALGALLRVEQVIVVGDQKQLPPSQFFNRSGGAEATVADDEMIEDLDDESILEACAKTFRETRLLKWHYRSRCESLIAFSNREFYGGDLITFPSALPRSFSVDLVRLPGRYASGRNPMEAQAVAEESILFMRQHADEGAPPSLGVVSVNSDQRDLIEEEIRRLASEDELVLRYQEKVSARGEPFFVKNLENVQGDERDYIFISMTYGPAVPGGVVAQRFGPIAGKHGHRRLNVLFTRARLRIVLFASFGSKDVRPSETSAEGVRILKRYFEYAERRGYAEVADDAQPDSDFEVEVARRLRAAGLQVDHQVGVSGFRIDLGVRHPDDPEQFIAGVECDGARFHSSKSARDRDRLREEILIGLGWNIIRVWSTDWFDNPDLQTANVLRRIEELRANPLPALRGYRLASAVQTPDTGELPPNEVVASEVSEAESWTDVVPHEESVHVVATVESHIVGELVSAPEHLLNGDSPLTAEELRAALRCFRETIIAANREAWKPERSVLRESMIETLVAQRLDDPADWFAKVPTYLRSGTDPNEKRIYIDQICDLVARLRAEDAAPPAHPPVGHRAGPATSNGPVARH
ncbi:UNVERIFIED_ORG: very-short-patch-repair endonuclease/DNA polymerase III delta prime subunit [Methylorubrum zatmanii]